MEVSAGDGEDKGIVSGGGVEEPGGYVCRRGWEATYLTSAFPKT
jgi:hypothetical protein